MPSKKIVFNLNDKIDDLKESTLLKSSFKRYLEANSISITNVTDFNKILKEFKTQPIEVK